MEPPLKISRKKHSSSSNHAAKRQQLCVEEAATELCFEQEPLAAEDALPPCTICLEPVEWPVLRTPCNHFFCQSCLDEWFATQANRSGDPSAKVTCPNCVQPCNEKDVQQDKQWSAIAGTVLKACRKCSQCVRADAHPHHLSYECPMSAVSCSYAEEFGCRWRGTAAQRSSHENECLLVDLAQRCRAEERLVQQRTQELKLLEQRAHALEAQLNQLQRAHDQAAAVNAACGELITGTRTPVRTLRITCTGEEEEICYDLEVYNAVGRPERDSGFQLCFTQHSLCIRAADEGLRYPLSLFVLFAPITPAAAGKHTPFMYTFHSFGDTVTLMAALPASVRELKFQLLARKILI